MSGRPLGKPPARPAAPRLLAGVVLANAVSERVLELSFAAVQLMFAWQLAKKAGLR
jgi:hypothetical protein